jgi:hypothetical protein
MEPPTSTRATEILQGIAYRQAQCRQWGAAVYGLPVDQNATLKAAAAGELVPPDVLLEAIAAGEKLETQLGWDVFRALRRSPP